MYKYKLPNGQIYNVSEDRKEKFLSEYPDATLVTPEGQTGVTSEEQVDVTEGGKYEVDGQIYNVSTDRLDAFKQEFGERIEWVKPRLEENNFEHITEAQWLDVSDDNWFSREENAVKLLEKAYKYDKFGNLSGIKFVERFGASNNVEVILPGNDSG